ncbi:MULTISPECIES: 2-hydroxyacid dehydrogenase [Halomonas]|uniref:Glyoxylate/hydroxypyruvate reductase A n=1 Tax=Halomonas halophila TaxID=29573 RepID=A0ABQ0U0Y2_9GAMM|nr:MULTISPECIES: glyoxylate/hydroxypyruvate reductase A [Halomonas]MDR5888788.1 glyoxylate/hydroxypyruvate reductase A [Halomonas salina]RAH38687.1 glyoxylate/hydroxypyruvate reductase A [Halomonas sp. SL1]WJY07968.1 glyoxylate/hydroxypyruvate reductase A [Halomonas halophila]GEK72108.1 glyoxylate/hydroxypyruvate reductase A [Halomonas halophila]
MRVLVHTDAAEAWRDALAERLPDAEILTSAAPADERRRADYLAAWKPSAELLDELISLKGIVNLGAGVDALLGNPALPRGVPIVKLRDAGMAGPIADYARYGVLHFQRDFDRYRRQQARAEWRECPPVDKADWPVGVLGLGAIGARVAQSLADDGFPVHGWSRSPKTLPGVRCHHGDDGLRELLPEVKSLVLLLPDTPATRGIIDAEALAALPEGASLINPGRGSLIDEAALLAALGDGEAEGRLRGAQLDAFPEEPLPASSPLWSHPRVLITPHMAGPTPLGEALDQVAEALRAMDAGEDVETIDPDAGY